jgi:hypothetical protein
MWYVLDMDNSVNIDLFHIHLVRLTIFKIRNKESITVILYDLPVMPNNRITTPLVVIRLIFWLNLVDFGCGTTHP